MKTKLRRFIASLLIVSVTGPALPVPAQAGIVSTDAVIARDQDRIAAMLDRSEVRDQLVANGVSPAVVKARVAALTDEEAAQLAGQINSLPAGSGDPISTIVYGAALIIALPVVAVVGVVSLIAKAGKKHNQVSPQPQEEPADGSRAQPEQVPAPGQ